VRFPRTSHRILAVAVLATSILATGAPRASAADRDRTGAFSPSPTRPEVIAGAVDGTAARDQPAPGRVSWRELAPSPAFGYDAIPRIGGHWPADPTGALGVAHVLAAVNSSYALYDLTGVAELGPNPLGSLFDVSDGTQVFDPKVVYDEYSGTFVLAFIGVNDRERRSSIFLVSIPDATAEDATTWCGARVVTDRTTGDGRQFADYPGLGYDAEHVVVTLNNYDFQGNAFNGASVLSFPKARLYDCSRSLTFATFTGAETQNPSGSPGFTIQPAVTVGPGKVLYLTTFDPGKRNVVVLWRLSERGGEQVLRNTDMRVPVVRISPYGTQRGGSLERADTWWDPGDLRLVSTFADLDAGAVYTAHVIGRNLRPDVGADYTEAAIRWYEIRPSPVLSASRVVRVGTVGTPQTDAGWPSLATDASGNLFVTYNRASALSDEYLSAWIAEIAPGETAATNLLLRAGTARVEAVDGPERWGDYTAMSRDPVDGRFVAAVNQIAVADAEGSTRDWQQTIDVVSHQP
jgi:hypothetical protein